MSIKTYAITIPSTQLETAINLEGWSHVGPERKVTRTWYPFSEVVRAAYFQAPNYAEACRRVRKVFGHSASGDYDPIAK